MVLRRAFALVAVCLYTLPARAQTPPSAKPTLAAALAQVTPPSDVLLLTVGADKVTLPDGGTAMNTAAAAPQVAAAYGRSLRTFGTVSAIAPPTMIVLNTSPINPNPYDGLGNEAALKLLTASLAAGQWQVLTGEQGLGLGDLTSDTQKQLFMQILPPKLRVVPHTSAGSVSPVVSRDVTDELPQARLRLRRETEILMPVQGGTNTDMFADSPDPTGIRHYDVAPDSPSALKASLYGAPVRAEVPNTPKTAQLDYDSPVLRTPIPVTGLKTVGDLVSRIGNLTHTELYADARYERRPLTIVGASLAPPASDLLRAVAFCLTGTYRRVGPAFVLTDDLVGVGTRRQIWREFGDDAAAMREAALEASGDKLSAAHALNDLADTPSPLAMTPEQQKQAGRNYKSEGFAIAGGLRLDQLTPAQQEAVRSAPAVPDGPGGASLKPDLTQTMQVQQAPVVQLLVPSLDGPVNLSVGLVFLFQSGAAMREQFGDPDAAGPPPMPKGTTTTPLAVLTAPLSRRGVLVTPAARLGTTVTAMRALGLNQMWVPIFRDGALDTDRLGDALQAVRGSSIKITPVLDLFTGDGSTPQPERDLTILGETSVQAQARRQRRAASLFPTGAAPAPPSPLYVSPFSPRVFQSLVAAVRALAATPGIAGLAWRDAVPPGYDLPEQEEYFDQGYSLGYTPEARLAFLRQFHADPVDVSSMLRHNSADTSLPGFDDAALDGRLNTDWRQFRSEQHKSLLRALYRAAFLRGKPVPIFAREHGRAPALGWFGSWDGPRVPLPVYDRYGQDARTQAKAQSRTVLLRLPLTGTLFEAGVAAQWRGAFEQMVKNKVWDGFVLDMTGD